MSQAEVLPSPSSGYQRKVLLFAARPKSRAWA